MTKKIRSVYGPLIRDYENWLRNGSIGRNLIGFVVWVFGGTNSEKGYTRKHTGIRVTRWHKMFWGNIRPLTLFYEENGV
jgi:hypothetical protein